MPRKSANFNETLFELLKDPAEAAAYLNEHLNFQGKGSAALFLKALKQVSLAQGMDHISTKSKLTRRSLEKALSEAGNPRFSTLTSVLNALGLQMSIARKSKKRAS